MKWNAQLLKLSNISGDCLEITAIPMLPTDNPKKLVKELGSLIGAELDDDCISTAHQLLD